MRLTRKSLVAPLLAAVLLLLSSCAELATLQAPGTLEEANSLHLQVTLLHSRARYAEGVPLAERALAIFEKALGPGHPHVAQSRFAKAEPLFWKALVIREKRLGPDHPNIAKTLNNVAKLYEKLGKPKEAAALSARAKAMQERLRRGR